MATTLRIGFIGAGCVNFGGPDGPWDHATRLEKLGNIDFVGIADPNTDRCNVVLENRLNGSFKKMWQSCQVYGDVSKMLADAKPHAVFIGVPPFCHGSAKQPLELTCVKAGVHCFVEKPLANSPADETTSYASIVEGHASKPIVSVGYMFRHSKWVKHMLKVIKDHGKPLVCFNAQYTCAYAAVNSPFWWDTDFSGGPIVEQATHFIDLARYIVGDVDHASICGSCVHADSSLGGLDSIPKSVNEAKIPVDRRIPRNTVVNWRFKSGALGSLVHAALLQGTEYDARLEVLADGLRIRVEKPYSTKPQLFIIRGAEPEQVIEFPDDDPYLTEDDEFITAVRDRVENGEKVIPVVTCSYTDGAKTYALSCKMREVTTKK